MSRVPLQSAPVGQFSITGKLITLNVSMPSSPENPRPTIHDVAAALGMHKSTVSQGLSGKGTVSASTRQRILKVAQEMGYEPNPLAQRLANRGSNKLVYLCSYNLDVGIGTEKILSIQSKLKRLGWEVPIYSVARGNDETHRSQAEEIRDLCRQQPRAIVYATHGAHPSALPELQRYQQDGGIVVCYDAPVPLHCDQVVFDREHNAYQAARYLIERGHTQLGISLPFEKEVTFSTQTNPRIIGFCRALGEAGLDVNDQWFFKCGDYEKGGQQLAANFLSLKNRPTGLCVVNDYSALAFMSEVMEAGVRIPHELSVVGHDNQPVAKYCPVPLTCAVQPAEEIAQSVVDLLSARLSGNRDDAQTLTIRGELVERKSVATHAP
ncbi:LacI family transcriptional regulator [bacterium]|nr:MAG: LacI family transcriptional regulator [bacterium]